MQQKMVRLKQRTKYKKYFTEFSRFKWGFMEQFFCIYIIIIFNVTKNPAPYVIIN